MLELGGSGQGLLGGVEGLLHQRGPSQGLARTLKCVGQRKQKTGSTLQKPALEVHKPKETLTLTKGVENGPPPPHGQGAGGSLRPKPDVPKLHLLLAKDRLLGVDGEVVLSQAAKHLTKMLLMRGVVRACNQHVVKIDQR